MGGAAVVANDPQHVLAVLLVAGEGAEEPGHFGRGGIAHPGHDGGERARDLAAGVRIVGQARRHQQAAEIGVAQAERAELEGELRDLARGELRHQHRDFEHHGPQPHRVLVAFEVELPRGLVAERQQVHGGEIARRVVEEHVFRARIAGADRPGGRAGVPVVHGRVVLQAGIGACPGGVADLLPQLSSPYGVRNLTGLGAPEQIPVRVGFDRLEELVGDAHRVVGVLARDREIGVRIPVGVVDRKLNVVVALLGELDHPLDVIVRNVIAPRGLDLAPQHRVLLRIEAIVARAFAVHARLHDQLEVLLVDPRAGDEVGHLLLLDHLPVDELLDVGMVGIDDHHLGGAAGGAARLDGARGAVADLEEAHQAGGLAAACKRFVFAAQAREVRAGARAVFEQARFPHPQVHDPAFVDEIVGDRLDEAGVRLRMLVGGLRLGELSGLEVDVEMSLARPVDAVGPEQTGVEPLRRVRRRHLHRQHVDELIEEGAGVVFRIEIAALPSPIGPGAGEPFEHLLGGMLAGAALVLGQRLQRLPVGGRSPQPRGNGLLLDLLQSRRHACLAEILLRQHVGGDLRPEVGHLDVVGVEHDRAVGIADLARGQPERDVRIG